MNEDAVKFASLLTEDNKRLRADLAAAKSEAYALERELMLVVALAGGRVERTAGVDRPERDPKMPVLRYPVLRRVYDGVNDRTVAWVIEEEIPASADIAA